MARAARAALLLLATLAILSGCGASSYLDPEGPRYAGEPTVEPPEAPEEGETIRVVSFNIEHAERIALALRELREAELEGAAILMLQEMDAEGSEAIAEALGMHWVYYPASIHTHGRDFGNAILSPWPILEDHKLLLPHGAPFDGRRRIAVAARIDAPRGPIWAYCVHNETMLLELGARLDQVEAILADAEEQAPEGPLVIGGDFNTFGNAAIWETARLFEAAGLGRATPATRPTADSDFGSATLDHLFVRGFSAEQSGLGPDLGASDHRALWADLRRTP